MDVPENSLCRRCGLCCDGSLFADVILGRDELNPIEQAIGYEARNDRIYLQQPCLALCNGDCQIYSHRPDGCRTFECQLLKEVKAGQLTTPAALEKIKRIKERIEKIKQLLEDLDYADRSFPLSYQCESALSAPWDLSAPQSVQDKRDQLYQSVAELEAELQDQFRS